MIDALEVGYAIKDRRAELGLTQAQVASAAGVSKRFLWSLELGQNSGVQLDKLSAVLDVLGLDLVILPRSVSDVYPDTCANAVPQPDLEDCIPVVCNIDPGFNAQDILTGKAK